MFKKKILFIIVCVVGFSIHLFEQEKLDTEDTIKNVISEYVHSYQLYESS